MPGKLYLSGGGDEKQTFELDKIFLKDIEKILYIPIAWPDGNYEKCLEWFKDMSSQHKELGIEMLVDLNKPTKLSNFDAIYIGGGNTYKLLKAIKKSGFDKKLIHYHKAGGIIYGGSAGALIIGRNIDLALICEDKDKNLVNLQDTSGLNLVKNLDIQCHFKSKQIKEHQEHITKTKTNIIAIPEESALLVEKNQLKVIGTEPIILITENDSQSYKVNSIIDI